MKMLIFLFYIIKDTFTDRKDKNTFKEYGLTLFCGRQGSGKTTGMVWYLNKMREKYPDVIIVTNFGYVHQDYTLNSWRDLTTIRNGTKGVIFAIDEIQNEFSSTEWQKFPAFLLSEITQQRKQRVKIVGTSQVFTRVAKQIREQTYEVVECLTLKGRWTFLKAFDAERYNRVIDNPDKKLDLKRVWRANFLQDTAIRSSFDSYYKIQKVTQTEFRENNLNKAL